ncbi:DUF1214 domain-containing protein [Cupriavidus sp. a3]|uniref:DUF1214 domain-containing protein n=1 Tax=Cupriavidus sp. a3 TaxID=3242158 RepID=UPI003D9C2DD6
MIPDRFFDQFEQVLDTVPPLPGEEALYGQFRSMMDAAKRDPEVKKAIGAIAADAERDVIGPFFEWRRNGLPAGNGWNRSTNNAQTGLDYFDRTGTAKSNMFDNRPNETQYFYTDFDASGGQLSGASTYEIVFTPGQEPPVNGFWSLTLYNDKHLFHANDLKRYSLGTKKNLKRNADGSLTLYAGAKSPGSDKESNWLPAPGGAFSLYIRAYWGGWSGACERDALPIPRKRVERAAGRGAPPLRDPPHQSRSAQWRSAKTCKAHAWAPHFRR